MNQSKKHEPNKNIKRYLRNHSALAISRTLTEIDKVFCLLSKCHKSFYDSRLMLNIALGFFFRSANEHKIKFYANKNYLNSCRSNFYRSEMFSMYQYFKNIIFQKIQKKEYFLVDILIFNLY